MRAYSARHITRLASYNGTPALDYDLVEHIRGIAPEFTNPQIFKIQIMVDAPCKVLINGNSEIDINPTYGLTIDYSDLLIHSFVFKTDNVNVYAVIGY